MTSAHPGLSQAPARPSPGAGPGVIVLAAGLTAALVEMVFVLPIQAYLGASPVVVFQSIAAGALGKAALSGGLSAFALGVAVHLLVSFVAAAVYLAAVVRLPWLDRHPVLGGLAYGLPVYVFMTFGVIPLSRIGFHPPKSAVLMAASIAIHVFAFALPIAMVVAWLRHGRLRPTASA